MADDRVDPEKNPWIPMTDPVDVALVGKAQEELNELGAVLARCLIQGVDGVHPVTRVANRAHLQDEMADVYACMYMLRERFYLNEERGSARVAHKRVHIRRWLAALDKKVST